MLSYELAELTRMLANIVRPATVAEVDHSSARVRVKSGDILTGWLPSQARRAGNNRTWSLLEVGEQVIVLSPDGNLSQGFVLGSFYSAQHSVPSNNPDLHSTHYSDGAVISYDSNKHHLDVTLPAGATANIVSDGGITLTGDTTLTGNLTVIGNISSTQDVNDHTRTMSADRAIFDAHTHSGVASGGSKTSTP